MVGQYVFGLRPFFTITTTCTAISHYLVQCHAFDSSENQITETRRFYMYVLPSQRSVNRYLTPSSRTPCVTRVLSCKQTDCAFLQHSAVPIILPFNRNKLALKRQRVIYNITANYSYNNWSCHVTYLFFQFTFYADTSCPSSKSFFVIYAS